MIIDSYGRFKGFLTAESEVELVDMARDNNYRLSGKRFKTAEVKHRCPLCGKALILNLNHRCK